MGMDKKKYAKHLTQPLALREPFLQGNFYCPH